MKNTYVNILKIYRLNPSHILNTSVLFIYYKGEQAQWRIYSGNKGKSCRLCTWTCAWWLQTHLLPRQVWAALLPGGAQHQHSSQEKNGRSVCQEQELQLLIGLVPFDPLTHFFQREALEGLFRRGIMGRGASRDMIVWWSEPEQVQTQKRWKSQCKSGQVPSSWTGNMNVKW